MNKEETLFYMVWCLFLFLGVAFIVTFPVMLHNLDNAYNLQRIEQHTGESWVDRVDADTVYTSEQIWMRNYQKLWNWYQALGVGMVGACCMAWLHFKTFIKKNR